MTIENEIWSQSINGYEISDHGRFRNRSTGYILSEGNYSNGYKFYAVKRKGYLAHRLVALAFIPNPDNKRCVNHKDGNKSNNHISNLEWMTYSENHKHAYDNLNRVSYWKGRKGKLHSSSRKVYKLDKDGTVIAEFDSAQQASLSQGYGKRTIDKAVRGKYRIYGHYYTYAPRD
jgi:hypothetical protein